MSEIARLSAALAKNPERVDLVIALARAHATAGRWSHGVVILRQAAQLHPNHRDLAHWRVQLLVQAEQWKLAVREATTILRTLPDHAEVWQSAAQAFSVLNMHGLAIDAWKSSLVHRPDNRWGWFALGNLQLGRGRYEKARASFLKAHEMGPLNAAILTNLGASLLHGGDLAMALRRLTEAVETDPEHVQAQVSLAQCHMTLSDEGRADEAFRAALKLAPSRIRTRVTYARFLTSVGRSTEAESQLSAVLSVEPDNPAARRGLGRILERRGQHAAAVALLEPLMTPDLKEVGAMAAWARACVRTGRSEAVLPMLRARAERPLVPTQAQVLLHAIGDVHKAKGDWAAAFAAHQRGNRCREREVDTTGFVREVADTARLLGEPVSRSGSLGQGMTFIVGMPRSGTSLVEQILSRHPAVTAGGELPSLNRTLRQPEEPRVGSAWAERLAAAGPDQWEALGRRYLADAAGMASLRPSDITATARLTDKQPTNFVFLGAIARILPGARIIHCVRDPLDTCLSCFFQNFGPGHAWSTELAWIAEIYRAYRSMMTWWTEAVGLEVIDVRYESVVDDLEAEVRRILAALDLPFHPACLAFHEGGRDARTASVDQVRRPIYRSSVRRSERYLPWLQPLVEGLGDLDALPAAPDLVPG